MPATLRGQRGALDLLELNYKWSELQCRCWGLNLGPLDEHQILLTADPSLQPYFQFFNLVMVCGVGSPTSLWVLGVHLTALAFVFETGSYFVAQADLNLRVILLFQLLEYWD